VPVFSRPRDGRPVTGEVAERGSVPPAGGGGGGYYPIYPDYPYYPWGFWGPGYGFDLDLPTRSLRRFGYGYPGTAATRWPVPVTKGVRLRSTEARPDLGRWLYVGVVATTTAPSRNWDSVAAR
jgi:hypothetical protein